MKAILYCFLASSVLLTGCSTLNENFDCPAPQGGSCKRMDEIYDELNGTKRHQQEVVSLQKAPGSMKVWVAPYQDDEGNYHPAKAIYSTLCDV